MMYVFCYNAVQGPSIFERMKDCLLFTMSVIEVPRDNKEQIEAIWLTVLNKKPRNKEAEIIFGENAAIQLFAKID